MTTKISAIIAQYIATETRLVIPEVGTLIRRKESGEVVFMEILRKSDGVLVGLIVNTLDVSPSKANEIANNYIATIKQQLARSKKFVIDGVGVLLLRGNGSIDFSFNPFAQSIPEPTKGFDVLEEDEVVEVAPAPSKPIAPIPSKPIAPAAPKVAPAPQPAQPQPQVVTPKPQPQPEVVTPKPQPQAATPKAEPTKVVYRTDEDDVTEKRRSRIQQHHTRKKVDGITVVAIVAVLMALLALVWGLIPANDQVEFNLNTTTVEVNE